MNKYNWSNVPEQIEWVCTDADANVFGFTCFPSKVYSNCFSCGSSGKTHLLINATLFYGNWKESLERRPNE